jgi:Haemolymph juvenile hormone binding protein (JHBP)
VLDIQGKGDMDGTFENARARVRMIAKKYQKGGETFLKFDLFNLKIQIGKNRLSLKNLFNGDPSLGNIGNQFINENSELFLSEVIPGLEKNLAEIFTKTANEIVETASFDEMFPNIPPKSS